MKRPACETCAYSQEEEDAPLSIKFQCRRNPPVLHSLVWVAPDDFCGEHPDFPAYIESLKGKDDE